MRSLLPTLLVAACMLGGAGRAIAQCTPMNPSFEIAGSGVNFAGWNQFGTTGTSTAAIHGSVAAKVSGPNSGSWDVSGYWQQLE
jgi:hypothetical protein